MNRDIDMVSPTIFIGEVNNLPDVKIAVPIYTDLYKPVQCHQLHKIHYRHYLPYRKQQWEDSKLARCLNLNAVPAI